jgi:hypothetical protein
MTEQTNIASGEAENITLKIQSLLQNLPASIWSTTTPATLFRIANKRAEYVSDEYSPNEGDLVFQYKNDDGYISIKQIYPPKLQP